MTNETDASLEKTGWSRPLPLKSRVARGGIVVAPGVYDALTASLAASAGFEALYLSGAAIAYTKLGRPDIGLVSMTEVADALAHVCERVETPVIVDADTGYGNALNVQRTVRLLERAGAAAIQLEDQTFPKRCGHLADKGVMPVREMVGKIRAAVDARRRDETIIIARTDAVAVEGFDAAIERARAYAEAGADILFVEAPRTREQLGAVARALWAIARLCSLTWSRAGRRRYSRGLNWRPSAFASSSSLARSCARSPTRRATSMACLKRDGTTDAFRDRMFDFAAINAIVGTPDMLARGRRYEDGRPRRRARPDERARSGHARRPQGAARADRRRNGRDALSLRLQSRSSPRRTTPATGSITRRPARRWCRARRVCRSSSARWPSR